MNDMMFLDNRKQPNDDERSTSDGNVARSIVQKFTSKKVSRKIAALIALCILAMNLSSFPTLTDSTTLRALYIDLGDGKCKWTQGEQVPRDEELFQTLIVGYPGSGKRIAFLQLEGLTGLTTGDDFDLSESNANTKFAFIKTSYPQHEGIWAQQGGMDQSILLVRNPRWAIPGYHHILYEINYAKNWQESYLNLDQVYTKRANIQTWLIWREMRAVAEIRWWGWFVDFWMEGGLMRDIFTHEITTPEHFEKLMQPHKYTESELSYGNFVSTNQTVTPSYDYNCLMYLPNGCKADQLVQFEKIINHTTGVSEAWEMGSTLVGKEGINLISEEARPCIWEELIIRRKGIRTEVDRDNHGPPRWNFNFTQPQMHLIQEELHRVRDKYSSEGWASMPTAQSLVSACNQYIEENDDEIHRMIELGLP